MKVISSSLIGFIWDFHKKIKEPLRISFFLERISWRFPFLCLCSKYNLFPLICLPGNQMEDSVDYLKTYGKNILDIFRYISLFQKITFMAPFDILHQLRETAKAYRLYFHTFHSTAFYISFQMVLEMLLIFIMLIQITCKVYIMRKGEIICHIMHHFS